jgi:7-carboxy-7-deazaguanine synthase
MCGITVERKGFGDTVAYAVKEIFHTLQGEGAQAGRAAVFCRFADATALADAIARTWAGGPDCRFVVFTGGEPLLQLDAALIDAVHGHGFEIAIETNGTLPAPPGIDWICVSPKGANPLAQTTGHELKLVYPQADADPADFVGLAFRHRFLQPMDGPEQGASTQAAIAYCRQDARWRLSLQTHKMIGIP